MENKPEKLSLKNAAIQLEDLCKNAVELIQYSRGIALKQVDLIQLMTYFTLGKWIVDVQQDGQTRAKYGKNVLNTLSDRLNKAFGKGFSVSTLTNIRKFYLTYQERISEPVVTEFAVKKSQPPVTILQMEASRKGQVIEQPQDIVKDPYVLGFLGLDETADFSETELESHLIDHLQKFLLELGTGFSFVARQKRFTFEEEHSRVDLVFYNRILMCPDKNDAVVELTLPKDNSQIFASQYQLYLPDKTLLQNKLKEWIAEETEGEKS